tara:strand:+ start:1357 stop:1626 length:270 start_codon:yes stop_codon:yes gene_type:complete
MERFKPLIEYYKNIKNLLTDTLFITLFIVILYYISKNYRKQFNMLIDIPSIIIAFLIGRSYKLNIISFNEFIIYFIILLIVAGIIKYKI